LSTDVSEGTLMMEAARTSETSIDNYFTRQYIPEDNSEQFNAVLPSTHWSFKQLLDIFRLKYTYNLYFRPPAYLALLDFITVIIFYEEYNYII
jgi:hypothetical protein